MPTQHILLVEPDQVLRTRLVKYLAAQGYQVATVADAHAALALLEHRLFDVIVTAWVLPGDMQGLNLINYARDVMPHAVILVMTAQGSLDSALEAFRHGAHDYLVKPFALEDLGHKLANIAQFHRLLHENRQMQVDLRQAEGAASLLIGKSRCIRHLIAMIAKVAASHSTVLITGESGTGKELVSRSLHENSRRKGLFVPLNVAAIPESLIESHLFGHVRGAFTGADRAREGAFRAASDGTLFLDEIGELPLSLQAKLLRTLEEKEVWPVGSDSPVKVNARVIAATHRDLKQMSREGKFREDLLFRLNVVNLHVPPLRERIEDIPALVSHFIDYHQRDRGNAVVGVDSEAMQCLLAYSWPGNVRELSNVIERAVLLCEDSILRTEDLPGELRMRTADLPQILSEAVQRFQYGHILSVLESQEGNRELTAKILGLSSATLYRLIEKLGLKGYRYRGAGRMEHLVQAS